MSGKKDNGTSLDEMEGRAKRSTICALVVLAIFIALFGDIYDRIPGYFLATGAWLGISVQSWVFIAILKAYRRS
jgi:hypothetical protein